MKRSSQPTQEPVLEIIEERLHAWRERQMNRSGDRLALDDYMSKAAIEDLIDFVCAPLPSALTGASPQVPAAPIDMILHCPKCGLQHVDAPEGDEAYRCHLTHGGFDNQWHNPPHRSHLCHGCGHIWRPADVPTNGVASIKSAGKADSQVPAAAQVGAVPVAFVPVHPRSGPLWANTVPASAPTNVPASYPLMPLYERAVQPAPLVVPEGWRGLLKRLRSGLAAGSRSITASDFEIDYGCALLDAVAEVAAPALRVWWIPQVPMEPFHVPVASLAEAKKVLDVLAQYDLFQLAHNIKPDYCNAGGLQAFSQDGDDEWCEWYDPETGDDIDALPPTAHPVGIQPEAEGGNQ